MAKLTIDIEESGVVRISTGGVVIGLVRALELRVDEELQPMPHIHISFSNLDEAPKGPEKTQLKRTIQRYKDELRKHPLVRVTDYHDTLPQGMPAVRPEEEE